MQKDFDKWNEKKKFINKQELAKFCHSREIWWCSIGTNIGFEQDGTGKNFDRPILVIRGFNENLFFGVALIGKKKEGKFYFYIGKVEDRDATAVLSQARLIDTKRLVRKITTLDEDSFEQLKTALKKVLID